MSDSGLGTERFTLLPYAGAVAALGAGTAVALAFDALDVSEVEIVLAYVLAVTAVAAFLGRGPAMLASVGAVLLFNFLFTSPRYTFEVHDSEYVFTFAVMLVIGLSIGTLTARVREQSIAAGQRERRAEQLFQLSRDLSATTGSLQLATTAENRLSGMLDSPVSILVPDAEGRLRPARASPDEQPWTAELRSVAERAYERGEAVASRPASPADARVLCLPLRVADRVIGVLAIRAAAPDLMLLPDSRRLIETSAAQVALALERDRLAEQAHRTLADAENQRLRNAVLSSVSHDFRTPLAAIAGASSSLLDAGERIDRKARDELLLSIHEEAEHLARVVDNLLHMTRLEAGALHVQREWNMVEDLVGSTLTRLARQLGAHDVTTHIPVDLPLLFVDGVLIELVLANLVDNAAKYSPRGTEIEIGADIRGEWLSVTVADRGAGVVDADKARVFEKFYRGEHGGAHGAGLGLAICAAIVRVHGGRLRVEDRAGGGSRFVVELPVLEQPPAIPGDTDTVP